MVRNLFYTRNVLCSHRVSCIIECIQKQELDIAFAEKYRKLCQVYLTSSMNTIAIFRPFSLYVSTLYIKESGTRFLPYFLVKLSSSALRAILVI